MQNKVQLYIENQRVDLFSDETIEVNSSIQDFRDIGKIFSDYTQSFNIPASSTNNKIFKHFYNFNITGGAYDNRTKKEAVIEINYLPFRDGKVYLNGVKMRNNKPHTYNITFYGKTAVSIKDTIGDDLISQLTYLDNYIHDYTDTNVKDGFQNGLNFTVNNVSQTDAIIYPLITSKKRLFYNSTDPVPSDADFDGNLFRKDSVNNNRGLEYTDLKPAIKAIHIIEAIEDKYEGIEFTRDFFGDNTAFSNLYMWLNPKKEEFNYIEDNSSDQPYLFTKKLSDYTSSDPYSDTLLSTSDSKITIDTQFSSWEFYLSFDVSNANTAYKVIVRDTDTGTETITEGFDDASDMKVYSVLDGGVSVNLEIELTSESALTFSNLSLNVTRVSDFAVAGDKTYTISGNPAQASSFSIDIAKKAPEMRVVDFLTGIFKTFNLTAYYIEDVSDSNYKKIYVDTLDNYYADAVNNKLTQTINLDKYVDIKEHQVDSLLPFTDIEFKYAETNTVFMDHHQETFKEIYGNAQYNIRENLKNAITGEYNIDRGTKYNIDVGFSHLKYERILDTKQGGTITDIQWGYCAGGEFSVEDESASPKQGDYESKLIKPLLFYGVRETSISTPIAWYNGTDVESLTDYYRPSNTNESGDSDSPSDFTLNFEEEFDEWSRQLSPNSLYEKFYKSYVEGVFNPLRRVFRITAYLPASILVNYKLNHQIKIGDKMFRINSINVDLTTGKSQFELYNIFEEDIV